MAYKKIVPIERDRNTLSVGLGTTKRGGPVKDEQIEQAVSKYFVENPVYDGYSVFQFQGENYTSVGNKYAWDDLGVITNGREIQVGDFVIINTHLTRVTAIKSTMGGESVFVFDMKGKAGENYNLTDNDKKEIVEDMWKRTEVFSNFVFVSEVGV